MDRARRAGFTALIIVVLVAALTGSRSSGVLAGVVGWPTSSLVVSEVQTGGASASDEFVEIAAQGPAPVDLMGLEVVYATSSGSTVIRKAAWVTSTIVEPGRRLLIGNSSGVFGSISDATYSGGFAATGGAIAIRVVGGAVVDLIGWGDATSTFVEGTAAPAPPAASSLERRPGGSAGNGIDTNDNAVDWFVQAAPSPQGLSAPPIPDAGSPSPMQTPSPSPTATPTSAPSPTVTPAPTPTPVPTSTATATPTPTPTVTPAPTSTPSAVPSPTPIATPTPSPTPQAVPIAGVRTLPDGAVARIEGVLTTSLGALESGRAGFIQDGSGGIALYLDETVTGSWPAGLTVTVEGSVGSRFSQRTLRIAEAGIHAGPAASLPDPLSITTGTATEAHEGIRVTVSGTVDGAPDQLTDGLGVTLDDGSGPVRVVIGPDALAGRTVTTGMLATVSGPLGQRDSSGTGVSGYRIQATLHGELELAAPPTPTPTLTPTPSPSPVVTPTPSAAPTATPSPIATPTPAPTATPRPTATPAPTTTPKPTATPKPTTIPTASPPTLTLAAVRQEPIGTTVRTTGVVAAEAGRLGSPMLLAIVDPSGGLVVHLPSGAATYARGTLVEVTGKLAAPYGQLEVRPAKADLRTLGSGSLPTPVPVASSGLTEPTEGRLVTATGRITAKPKKTAAGVLTIVLERDGASAIKVMADPSSRIVVASLKVGSTYRVVGFVGQRATRSGALDGYRVWVRDAADLAIVAGPTATPSPAGGPGSPKSSPGAGSPAAMSIARALTITDRDVAIDAIVTVPSSLLDSTRRRIVVQDASGAVEVLLPTETTAPPVGTRVHAIGRIGVAYDAPRLRADRLTTSGSGPLPAAVVLHGQPGVAHEWRLVEITGRVDSVHKLGDRWRAEVVIGNEKVVVVGEAGAGIASSALVAGRNATVVGIARRPFPSATDRRFAVTPRFPADVRVDGKPAAAAAGATGSTQAGGTSPASGGSEGDVASAGPSVPAAAAADLVDLDGLIGSTVRVGGLVVDLRADGFTLDDGTATGRVILRGSALDVLPLIEPDDALEATGHVERSTDGMAAVVVDDPAGIVQASDPTGTAASPSALAGALAGDLAASPAPVAGSRLAGLGTASFPLDPGAAGLGTLLAISAASLAITVLRRQQLRRRMTARIATRLATLAGPSTDPPEPPLAERGPRTIHSA